MITGDHSVRYLRVWSRVVKDREPWLELTVDCPRRGRVAFDVCVDCSLCKGLVVRGGQEPTLVVCDYRAPLDLPPPGKPDLSAMDQTPISRLLPASCTCLTSHLAVEKVTPMFLGPDVRQAPVVDAAGLPIGMVTKTDILRWYWQKPRPRGGTVGEIMGPIQLILPDSTSVGHASMLLTRDRLTSAVVVSRSGRVVGLLSDHELLAWLRLAVAT